MHSVISLSSWSLPSFSQSCGWVSNKVMLLLSYRNKMSSTDQVEAVETLTRVASLTMGLQEQIEIIRIINPKATVLPTDTEFEIGKKWSTSIIFYSRCLFFSFSGQLHNSKACWSKLGVPDTTLYFFHLCLTLLGLTTLNFSYLVQWNTIKLSLILQQQLCFKRYYGKNFWCPFVGEVS